MAANQLTGVTTTKGADTSTAPYGYDEAGNTTTRPGQKLTWDAEGHVATVTEGSSTTSYLYDADGNRLITRSPSKTTLHLGHTEITLDKGATTAKATRYMALGGGNQAIRNNDGTFAFTLGDHQGTAGISVKADDLALSQRRNLPFGGNRGADSGTWPGTKGFVGGIDETGTTGLVHLGAREYDPAIGRFISVDPVLDVTDSQQMNGYNYANNSPVTLSDPDGLRPIGPTDSPRGDEEYARKNHGSQWINNGYGWYWKNVQQTKIQGHGTVTTTTYIGRSTRNHPAPRSSVAFTPIKPKPKVTSRPYMGAGMFGPPSPTHRPHSRPGRRSFWASPPACTPASSWRPWLPQSGPRSRPLASPILQAARRSRPKWEPAERQVAVCRQVAASRPFLWERLANPRSPRFTGLSTGGHPLRSCRSIAIRSSNLVSFGGHTPRQAETPQLRHILVRCMRIMDPDPWSSTPRFRLPQHRAGLAMFPGKPARGTGSKHSHRTERIGLRFRSSSWRQGRMCR